MITDDELLLYYYRELEADDRARIGAALAAQPELAQRLHKLVARLDAVASAPEVEVPEKFQQRWRSALDAAATWRVTRQADEALALLSADAVLGRGHSGGGGVRGDLPVPRGDGVAEEPGDGGQSGSRARQQRFRLRSRSQGAPGSTERQIASLRDATPEERAKLIDTIIGQNQMFALAAERAGEPQLARVLRAFTPILQDVASGRTRSANGDLAQLGFEMRIMQARLGTGARTPTTL